MKRHPAFILSLVLSISAFASPGHDHDHKIHAQVKGQASPNGGRLITTIQPQAEFFVTADRKIQITFIDKDGKIITPAAQTVTVITGERSSPVKLTFIKSGETLISEQPLPQGNNLPAIVQIKVTPETNTVTEKFNLNLEKCPTCTFAEYACSCH